MKTTQRLIRSALPVVVLLGVLGAAWGQEMCKVQGSDGLCAFPTKSFSSYAARRETCKVFQGSTYIGTCINGVLDGVALVKRPDRDGSGNFSTILYVFKTGVVDWPAISYGKNNLNVLFENDPRGYINGDFCVSADYAASVRKTKNICIEAASKFTDDVMGKDIYAKVKSGEIRTASELPQLRTASSAYAPAATEPNTTRDDPKVFGRSARGG
jgi:hypothetical protein